MIEQGNLDTTWTLITGGAGEYGIGGVTSISQGALYSMANVACRENATTNIRFNEVYLCYGVDYDSVSDKRAMKASDFARVYEGILANEKIKACRVSVYSPQDIADLKFSKKIAES